METRLLGTTTIAISPIILGTWQAGKKGWVNIDDQTIIHAMQAALEAGITTFDTAEIYGDGYSEELVGKVWEGLHRLIGRYMQPSTGYTARRALFSTRDEGDYEHLSRFGEWDMTDGAEKLDVGGSE